MNGFGRDVNRVCLPGKLGCESHCVTPILSLGQALFSEVDDPVCYVNLMMEQ